MRRPVDVSSQSRYLHGLGALDYGQKVSETSGEYIRVRGKEVVIRSRDQDVANTQLKTAPGVLIGMPGAARFRLTTYLHWIGRADLKR